jgi:RimJ/RimL family protein N-acetyltransferase
MKRVRIVNLQPHLHGQLVRLRPLQPDDFEALYSVASDPLIWELHPERYRYRRDVFLKFFAAAIDSKGALIILDSKDGKVLGSSRYSGFDLANERIEIGYTFFARDCWGKGFNTEAKLLMLKHAFQYVSEVRFFVGDGNIRSQRALEKLGATVISRIRRTPQEGDPYNAVVFQLKKDEFHLRLCVAGAAESEMEIVF